MLSSFRKGGLIQFMMGGVIIAIIVAFALDYRRSGMQKSFHTECAVQVGRSCVAPRDFTTAFSLAVRPDLTPKDIRRLGVRQMLLDGLVERQLLLDEARRLGISISEEKVDAELALGRFHFSMPAARDGQLPMLTYMNVRHPDTEAFNYDIYQRVVRNRARMSTKDFKVNQTEELIASRMRDLIKLGVRVSEAEALSQFEDSRTRATVRVGQVHSGWFARFSADLSDEMVRNFSQNQAAQVDAALAAQPSKITEGCPLVSEILFAFPPAADEKDEAETRTRAERVLAQAAKASAEDFAMLARIHSGAASADYGGKRGCLNEADGEEVAQLVKATEGLPPGATSKLVPQARGYYLLRLEDRPAADKLAELARLWTARPLAVRAAADALTLEFAKALIASLAPGKSMQDTLDSLTDNALAKSPLLAVAKRSGGAARASELEAAARESRHRPQVDVSPSFSRAGGATPVYNAVESRSAKQIAFALPAVDAVYAEPVVTRDGLAVMQLKDREPAKREDFDKEKSEFMRELKERAEVEALTGYLARLRQARDAEISVNPRFLEDKVGNADDS